MSASSSIPSAGLPRGRGRALLLVALAYALATAGAWWALSLTSGASTLVAVLAADVAATLVVFGFSRAFGNSSFYDPYWSIAPAAIALYLHLSANLTEGVAVRKWLALSVVLFWGARLTLNWLRSWPGLSHEDWRYVAMRAQFGRAYWPISLLGIHLFPTACTFAGCLPLFAIMTSARPVGALDLLGAGVALAGGVIEAIADEQLRSFRGRSEGGAVCDVGLWRTSRHPNYFGECTFWLGLWIMGAAAAPSQAWYSSAGVLTIVALFVFYSIPVAERRALQRRPEFAQQIARVSALIPWPRRD